MKPFLTLFTLFLMGFASVPSWGAVQGYFSVLPDLPLMAGMSEVEDRSFVFDKAEGRVIETAGFLPHADDVSVRAYYDTVLGQLGWKPLKNKVFYRDSEQLIVNIEKVAGGVVVTFQLAPLSR